MLCLALALTLSAAAPDKPVLMVLYFDNQTTKPEFDVMKKGLADMLITDLIAYDSVTVVERDKLEQVMGELKLQNTKAFDPTTRARLGKFVSAKYVISGSMIGVLPELRIDARLTDATTNVDLVSASVRGTPERLFDLEQELVGKLTAGIDAKLIDRTAARKMKGVDVDTVLAYSKGLDLEDQGKLEEARKQYAEVLKKKPAFMLPRDRTEALIKKMQQSESSRSTALSGDAMVLAKAIDDALRQDFDKLEESQQLEYLALRVVRGRMLGRALKEHLTSHDEHLRLVKKGHEAQVLAGLKGILSNYEQARDEHARYGKLRTKYYNGVAVLNSSARLPEALAKIAKEQELDTGSIDGVAWELPRFVLMGEVHHSKTYFIVGPALGDLDPRLQAAAFAALEEHTEKLIKTDKVKSEWRVKQAVENHALALFRIGKTEEGIAKLQRFLDEYPTSTQFKQVTRMIKIELGVERENTHEELLDYAEKGLKDCDYFGLYKGFGPIIRRRMMIKGLAGLTETVAEVEKACGDKKIKQVSSGWGTFYGSFARTAAHYDDCELSKALWAKALEKGASRSDLKGYQKNYHPWCQIIPVE